MLRLERFGDEVAAVEGQRLFQALPTSGSTSYSNELPVLAEHYRGCPYCQRRGLVACGSCGTISCTEPNATAFTCPSCGDSGSIGHVDVNIRMDAWQ